MRKLTLIAMLLGMPVLSHAETNRNSWDALNTLHAAQRIEVVEKNLKEHKGTFSTVSDEAIQLREGDNHVGIKRKDVMRVTLLDESHRLRNAFIVGVAVAGTGAGIGVVATRCSSTSGSLNFCGLGRGIAIGVGALTGLAGGAGIGAAIPSHPTVYRTKQH